MITDLQRGDFFQKGHRYRRKQIHKLYKGQEQSEISTPKAHPYIFIFTKESGSEYGTGHGWNKDKTAFFYTGEGQRGSMQLIKGNKALREHFLSGKAVYLFHYVEPGVVEFIDEVTYINHQLEIMWDSDGELREAIIFELERNPVIEEKAAQLDVSAYSTEQLRHMALGKEKRQVFMNKRQLLNNMFANAQLVFVKPAEKARRLSQKMEAPFCKCTIFQSYQRADSLSQWMLQHYVPTVIAVYATGKIVKYIKKI